MDKRTRNKLHFHGYKEYYFADLEKKYVLKEHGGSSKFDIKNEVYNYKDAILENKCWIICFKIYLNN